MAILILQDERDIYVVPLYKSKGLAIKILALFYVVFTVPGL
ncbi:hypothetical protein HMPREF1981_02915 [Bacteroides pyogenes F0041]|uniref:Uncharacterized protein n=1 Tax=Bacteroides pyogenes F0041 TaxID=1321819 RepID=U2BU86_9BACE|nr:hypothetical protein HMPREF1981_02915 [Bacteroides pyogenes F0041]